MSTSTFSKQLKFSGSPVLSGITASVKKLNARLLLSIALVAVVFQGYAQLSGTYSIPGSYASIALAVSALNTSGVSGAVVFNVAAGYTENAPASPGYVLGSTTLNASTSATNTITFQKSGAGADPLITANAGAGATDGIFNILGTDYVTINGIDLKDASGNNTPTTEMEFGYAFFYLNSAGTDACQYDEIENCTVTLNNSNTSVGNYEGLPGVSGIFSQPSVQGVAGTPIAPSGAAGVFSHNKFYGNTIQDVTYGVFLAGYVTLSTTTLDNDNDLGGASSTTGNTIQNLTTPSGATSPFYGILVMGQDTLNASYNTINNTNGGGSANCYLGIGIMVNAGSGANSSSFTVNNNNISLTIATGEVIASPYNTGTYFNDGIDAPTYGTLVADNNTITITQNPRHSTLTNGILTYGSLFGTGTDTINNFTASGNTININSLDSGYVYGINAALPVAAGTNLSITGNSITIDGHGSNTVNTGTAPTVTYTSISTNDLFGIYLPAGKGTITVTGNTLSITDSTISPFYGIYSSTTGTLNISNNSLTLNGTIQYYTGGYSTSTSGHGTATTAVTTYTATAPAEAVDFIYSNGTSSSETISGNTFYSDSLNITTSLMCVIYDDNNTPNRTISGNATSGPIRKHRNGSTNIPLTGLYGLYGIDGAASGTVTITGNSFSNVTADSGWSYCGIIAELSAASTTATMTVSHNTIANCFSHSTSTTGGGPSDGMLLLGAVTVDSNTISNLSNYQGTSECSGMAVSNNSTGVMTISNNNINNISNWDQPLGINMGAANHITNIYGNKIYDVINNNPANTGSAYGISISDIGTVGSVDTVNIYNNLIDSIESPAFVSASAVFSIADIYLSESTPSTQIFYIRVYDNTLLMNGSGASGYQSTCLFYGQGATAYQSNTLLMQNNILINNMPANGASKAEDFLCSENIGSMAYAAASNNNMFYAGTPSATNLIYYDGTNAEQTLANYKSFMVSNASGQDANSVTEANTPFMSTSPSSANFLKLDTTGTVCYNGGVVIPVDANDPGNNIDYFGIVREGQTGYTGNAANPTIGASEIIIPRTYTWTGATSTAWTLPANWSPTTQPGGPNACIDTVTIPVTTNQPVISSPIQVGGLTINSGATLTVNAGLGVCTSWTGGSTTAAIVTGSNLVTLDGSSAQTLYGNTQFAELALNNSAGATVPVGASVSIDTSLDLVSGQFTNNGTLTFLSKSDSTVGIIDNFSNSNSGTLVGTIIAQRYYASSVWANQHEMGSPVNSPLLSQFGANGTPGPIIPNYDCDEQKVGPGSPWGNVFSYNESNPLAATCGMGVWTVMSPSANATNGLGYSVIKSGTGTLSLTGTANFSNYSIGVTNSGWAMTDLQTRPLQSGWALLSNPYLASINLLGYSNPGIDAQVQVWNAEGSLAGSYQPSTTVAPFQAFLVHKTATGGTAYYEIDSVLRVRTAQTFYNQSAQQLSIVVSDLSTGLLDKTVVGFNPAATDNFDPQLDANKLGGSLNRQTLYSLNNGQWMAVNILNSINTTATVPLGFEPGNSDNFSFTFNGINTFDPTSYIYIEDTKTGIMQDVRNGDYSFNSNVADDWNRFVLHFTPPAQITTSSQNCTAPGMINVTQPGSANWNYVLTDNNNAVITTGMLNQNSSLNIAVNAGAYTLTLTDANNYSVVKAIQVGGDGPATAAFTASSYSVDVNSAVSFTNSSENASSVTWTISNGTVINGVANPTYTFTQPGNYTVTLTVKNAGGCISTVTRTIAVTSNAATGIGNVQASTNGVEIWSALNRIYVDFSALQKVDANIIIYDILGQQISNDKYVSSTVYSKAIDKIDAAYFVVMVKNGDQISTKKVFIENSK